MKKNLMEGISPASSYRDMPMAAQIYGSGNSRAFCTGDWRTVTPVFHPEKCKQCLLCYPVCPDSAIPVHEGKRQDFDCDHCKGCGICATVCPFDAISFEKGGQK